VGSKRRRSFLIILGRFVWSSGLGLSAFSGGSVPFSSGSVVRWFHCSSRVWIGVVGVVVFFFFFVQPCSVCGVTCEYSHDLDKKSRFFTDLFGDLKSGALLEGSRCYQRSCSVMFRDFVRWSDSVRGVKICCSVFREFL
jgi:hypothetical protein